MLKGARSTVIRPSASIARNPGGIDNAEYQFAELIVGYQQRIIRVFGIFGSKQLEYPVLCQGAGCEGNRSRHRRGPSRALQFRRRLTVETETEPTDFPPYVLLLAPGMALDHCAAVASAAYRQTGLAIFVARAKPGPLIWSDWAAAKRRGECRWSAKISGR
jgi:hypothetical protein